MLWVTSLYLSKVFISSSTAQDETPTLSGVAFSNTINHLVSLLYAFIMAFLGKKVNKKLLLI